MDTEKIDIRFITNVTNALYNGADISLTEIRDALSTGQLHSKLWLVRELYKVINQRPANILILGGWIGTLSYLLLYHLSSIQNIMSVDIDTRCRQSSLLVNSNFVADGRFSAATKDMYEIDYSNEKWAKYDTIINTSTEHIKDPKEWYQMVPDGKILILQSNNAFEYSDHISCVNNIEEMKEMFPMIKTYYSGSIDFPMYTRFMLIGVK